MPHDPRYDILFEPVRIGPKLMRNRFYQTPHDSALDSQYPGSEAYYRAMKAEGGWAVVNTGHVQVAADFDILGYQSNARLWDDSDIPNWALVAERIHEADALAGIELAACGQRCSGFESRLPQRAISNLADEVWTVSAPYEMDKSDIRRLQADYVAAAKRARSAGFDIVNIHGIEEWSLTTMFLAPHFNSRTDEYGGSLRNRARFWLETLEQVREAVGDDCAVAARHCIHTFRENGLRLEEEGVGFIEMADHLVDFWDLQVGDGKFDTSSSRWSEENFQGEWVAKVRPHTEKPIVGTGRFTSPDTMVAVIKSGQQDIIGAARATIADPFLPEKIEQDRADEIRECIACNVCLSRVMVPARIVCTQNATIGEEYRRGWHPERFVPTKRPDLSVLIVGAGPAGLECGIVLARQGVEHVHVVDAERQVGGHFRWVPRLPGLAPWVRLIDYRKVVAAKLSNLALVTNKRLSTEEVLDYGADRVIVATGSHWAADGLNFATPGPLQGADASLDHVYTPEQIMLENKQVQGERVVVYDCNGYFMGVSLAEQLAMQGKQVTVITPLKTMAPYLDKTADMGAGMTKRLFDLGVELVAGYALDEVTASGVSGHLRAYPSKTATWASDAVVLATQRVPDDSLYRELIADEEGLAAAGIRDVFRVGDCVAPRPQVADAIFDGHRLAREIDSEDPATPLPWIREGRFVGATDADFDDIIASHAPVARVSS